MEQLKGLGDIVGAQFRMKSNKGWLEYNRDAVIQFRHPDQADHAIKVINETELGNTKNNRLVAEKHFEEFNLRALVEHPCNSNRGPRVSIAAYQEHMCSIGDDWDVSPAEGIYSQ